MSWRFLRSMLERATRAAAAVMVSSIVQDGIGAVDVRALGWADLLSLAAGAALVEILFSLAGSQRGDDQSPSLLRPLPAETVTRHLSGG